MCKYAILYITFFRHSFCSQVKKVVLIAKEVHFYGFIMCSSLRRYRYSRSPSRSRGSRRYYSRSRSPTPPRTRSHTRSRSPRWPGCSKDTWLELYVLLCIWFTCQTLQGKKPFKALREEYCMMVVVCLVSFFGSSCIRVLKNIDTFCCRGRK